MGTHVPLVVRWKGQPDAGRVLPDLIDFTDFYATFAEAAGQEGTEDGRSFLPQLQGEAGDPRDWMLCHYQPYWNKEGRQFVRTADFKLYRDGQMYEVPVDLDEKDDLAAAEDPRTSEARRLLREVLERCPPVVEGKPDKSAEERPVYPEWDGL